MRESTPTHQRAQVPIFHPLEAEKRPFRFILVFTQKNLTAPAAGNTLSSVQLSGNAMIVAHRGSSKEAPENTLSAFNLAWAQDADAIEGDFHLTQDQIMICHHDPDIEGIPIKEMTFERLLSLNPDVPTLEQVLATVPEAKSVVLEIKCGSEAVAPLLEAIQQSGLPQNAIRIISFHSEVIRSVKLREPKLKAYWLIKYKLKFPCGRHPSLFQALETLKLIGADGLSTHPQFITRRLISKLNQAGFSHHVWTVDYPWMAGLFLRWGTETITTNVPKVMKNKLNRG